jgi:hypothetical protein
MKLVSEEGYRVLKIVGQATNNNEGKNEDCCLQ